jgi:hypothetical protein
LEGTLDGRPGHCGLRIFQGGLIDFFSEKWSVSQRLRASSLCFNIWEFPNLIQKETRIPL